MSRERLLKHSLTAVFLLALSSASVAGPADQAEKPWGTGKVTIENVVDLGVTGVGPARLSPDGSRVLFVERGEDRTYSYCLIGADGKNKAKVFATACKWDDLFTFGFGHGVWSPDGKQFIAVTADDPDGQNPRMAVCDAATGKATLLPIQKETCLGALFGNDGTVYYVDKLSPKKRQFGCTLRRYDPKGEKAEDLWDCADGVIVSVTMSPDRSRIGGLIAQPKPGGKGEPRFHLWAYDLATKKTDESKEMRFDDYSFGGGPWVFWDADGKALYANGTEPPADDAARRGKREFSIVRFQPFSNMKEPTTLLQEKKEMVAIAAFSPGRLSIFRDAVDRKFLVLDAATDKTEELNEPLFLIDRCGATGLFINPRTRKLCVARIAFNN